MKKFKTLLEFVKKKETLHGAIGLLEHGKFAKDISKLADKHGFDCYAKGYPKEKVDYEPTNKTYEIKTVEDIAELSDKQFEFFIDDLREYCNLKRNMKTVNDTVGVEVLKSECKGMTWLDTGLNEITVKFKTSNKI